MGSTSTRFVDHTSHRFFSEDEIKAWVLAYIDGSFIVTRVVYFRSGRALWQNKLRQFANVMVPVCLRYSTRSFPPPTQVVAVYGCWRQGRRYALILGPYGRVRSYRKCRGTKGYWRHKRSTVDLRRSPFPAGILISVHLVLASRFVYHEEWVRSHSTSNSPSMVYHRTL